MQAGSATGLVVGPWFFVFNRFLQVGAGPSLEKKINTDVFSEADVMPACKKQICSNEK